MMKIASLATTPLRFGGIHWLERPKEMEFDSYNWYFQRTLAGYDRRRIEAVPVVPERKGGGYIATNRGENNVERHNDADIMRLFFTALGQMNARLSGKAPDLPEKFKPVVNTFLERYIGLLGAVREYYEH